MALPKFHTQIQELSMLQTQWANQLDQVLDAPQNKAILLKDISLVVGDNVINHRLGRKPQGWIIADIDGVASIYRSEAFTPLTLTLNSSAAVTVTLEVF